MVEKMARAVNPMRLGPLRHFKFRGQKRSSVEYHNSEKATDGSFAGSYISKVNVHFSKNGLSHSLFLRHSHKY